MKTFLPLAAVLAAVSVLACGTTQAAPAPGRLVRVGAGEAIKTIAIRNTDLQSEAGARSVYSQLRNAAVEVCDVDGEAPDWVLVQDEECIDNAVSGAVDDLHSEPLRHVHLAAISRDATAPAYARDDR